MTRSKQRSHCQHSCAMCDPGKREPGTAKPSDERRKQDDEPLADVWSRELLGPSGTSRSPLGFASWDGTKIPRPECSTISRLDGDDSRREERGRASLNVKRCCKVLPVSAMHPRPWRRGILFDPTIVFSSL